MNKIALRTAVATALIAPAVVLGAGAASAAPVVEQGPGGDPYTVAITSPGETWACLMTSPNFGFSMITETPTIIESANQWTDVRGTCLGTGGVATLSGETR